MEFGRFGSVVDGSRADQSLSRDFMQKVFMWMMAGLLVTAGISYWASRSERVLYMLLGNGSTTFIILALIEVGIAIFMSARAARLAPSTAGALFFAYAILNGLTLTPLMLVYAQESVASAFLTTAVMFGAMCGYGMITKRDLTELGSFLRMGLIGLVIAIVVNFFVGSSTADLVISIMAVIIFLGLTIYDVNKLKVLAASADGSDASASMAIIGALMLYLDFVNIFIHLLRIMGRRK